VPTRWTAAYDMLKRLLLLQESVTAVLNASKRKDVRDLAVSPSDIYQLKSLCDALQPLCLATQGMIV